MPTLYLVATPIGNLEDITLRALRILREVSTIAAEDTRHTKKLLSHFDIHSKELISYHDHNKETMTQVILDRLAVGNVALVSDAGMPGINDPGYELVRAAAGHGYIVTPIPGASAPITALAASGLPTDTFLYLGYLARKKGERQAQIRAASDQPHTLIFLEAPHRLVDALRDLLDILGDRPVCVGREMTKQYETFVRGNLSDALAHFEADAPRGEITLVIGGAQNESRWDEDQVRQGLRNLLAEGASPSQAARTISEQSGWNKKTVYRMVLDISG